MWPEEARDHLGLIRFLAVSACLNIVLIFLVLWAINNLQVSLINDKVIASIVTTKEDEEFIKNVCNDLKLENQIVMVVGPYHVHSFFSPSQNYRLDHLLSKYPIVVDPLDPTRRILMEESIYIDLSAEERHAVLAHEIWHIYSFIKEGKVAPLDIDKEKKANKFATKYVNPSVLVNIYRRYGANNPEIQILINDLERL